MALIEKSEWKYLIMSIAFSLIWFLWIIPKFSKSLQGPMQFLFLNVGFTIIVFFILKCLSIKVHFKFKEVVGALLFILAGSIGSVPLMVGFDGVLSTGPTAYAAAADYNVALLWGSLGITGHLLYIFTYVVSPIILIFVAALLLKDSVRRA